MEMDKERRIATEILDEFEELLNEKDIMIPSEDREGNDIEAYLFGSEYFRLEDKITEILKENKLFTEPKGPLVITSHHDS